MSLEKKKNPVFQRNNLIRFHFMCYVQSGFFHRHLICHPPTCTISKQPQVTGYLKALHLYSPPCRQSQAQPLFALFLSGRLITGMGVYNLFLMRQTYGSHTKKMIKRQYDAIKASRHSSSEKDTSLTLYFKSPNRLCTHKTSIKFNRSRVAIVRAAMTPYRREHFWTSSFAVTQIFTSASLY